MDHLRKCHLIWTTGTAGVLAAALAELLSSSLFHSLGGALWGVLTGLLVWMTASLSGMSVLRTGRWGWLLLCLPALGLGTLALVHPLTGLDLSVFFVALTGLTLLTLARQQSMDAITLGTALLLCWFCCYCALSPLCLSPDSFSYYEMAKTLFSDFGRVSTIRQYVEFTDYGISFPYLYPLLLAVTDLLTGWGMYCGVLVNIVASLLAALLFLPLSRQVCGVRWPGLMAATALLTNRKFLSEVLSGRAIPVAVLCVVALLCLLSRSHRWSHKNLFLVGLLAGCSMAARFDNMTVVAYVGACVLFFSGRGRLGRCLAYGAGALLPLLPWVGYSLAHFGTPWVTDNGGTLTMVTIYTPQRFFLPGEEVATLFTAPHAWLDALGGRFSVVLLLLVLTFVSTQVLLPGGLLVLDALKNLLLRRWNGDAPKTVWFSLLLLVFYGLKTLAYCLVGYETARYHGETVVLVLFALCCLLAPYVGKRMAALCTALYLVLALWAGVVYATPLRLTVSPLCTHPSYASCINFGYQAQDASWPDLLDRISSQPVLTEEVAHGPGWVEELETLIGDDQARVFFLSSAGNPYAYGAYTGQTTFTFLANQTGERLRYLTRAYIKPTHIVVTGEYDLQWLDALSPDWDLAPLGQVGNDRIYICTPKE